MEAIKIGVRYNQRWDGDWGKLTVKDGMEWLQANGYYKKMQHARGGYPKGTKLKVDGGDGYWFWYSLPSQRAGEHGQRAAGSVGPVARVGRGKARFRVRRLYPGGARPRG